MKSRVLRAVVALCLAAGLPGCVMHETYGDPATPQRELALVEGYWHYRSFYDEDLHIVSVDGKRKRDDAWFHAYSVSLPAGAHWLQLAVLRSGGEIARCAFEGKFEAGHRYKLTAVHHGQVLLAQRDAAPFKASFSVNVTPVYGPIQRLTVAAECARAAMCRRNPDCPANGVCRSHPGFEFGTCEQGLP